MDTRQIGWRSLFFAPANRSDLVLKFGRFAADAYVIDLEDGTPPSERVAARAAIPELVRRLRDEKLRGRLLVRMNTVADSGENDLDVAIAAKVDGVVLPKCEFARDILHVGERVALRSDAGSPFCIVLGIETILGVLNVLELSEAHSTVEALYFGADDFATEMGVTRSEGGDEVLYARSRVVLAARAAGIAAIDQAVPQIRDDQRFIADATRGRNLGYQGKICLLPQQAKLAQDLFRPSASEIDRAARLLRAVKDGLAQGRATIAFEGQMIDGPHVKRAQAVIASADAAEANK